MRRTFTLLTLAVLLIGLMPLSAPIVAEGPQTAIRLKAATFRPGLGEKPNLPPGLTIAASAPGKPGYYLVQFAGPVQAAWKEQLSGLGAEILDYIPDYAFKVRMTPGQARKAEGLDSVSWVGLFHPAYKLSPDLVREGTGLYTVRIERGADAGLATAAVAATGAEVLTRSGSYLRVLADAAQIGAIARVLDVAWIQNLALQQKHNAYAAGGIMGATIANGLGYDGSTQIVAVADTGIGGGTASTAHPDIPASRITSIYAWTYPDARNCYDVVQDEAIDVDSGHGTHCSGSVLSDGGTDDSGTGVAPAASLVFQAVEEYVDFVRSCAPLYADGYYLFGIPDDIRELFQQAYDDGARVHSNSWGHDAAGDYDTDSANADDFVWNHPDMVITTSAGNEGVDTNGDGVVDSDSTGSPATAKNIITVGASENDRDGQYPCDTNLTYTSYDLYQAGETCQSMGGTQASFLGTWGQRYPDSFPAEPLASDVTAGNSEQMASWSSRGPTDDGRIKPDVVAPGTWILSAFSGLYQEGYGDPVNPQNGLYQWDGWGMPANGYYKYMGGTSMSNPLVAGGAAVVRDYYQKAYGHSASAALVKATLINAADDMLDENNDGVDDNDYPIPNVHEGWGRVNLETATDGTAQFVDEATGIGTGGSASYPFAVATAGQPFKVSLVWSDYPSTGAAAVNLVNDLDLLVTAPGGAVYRGNIFGDGWAQTGGSADRVNNVENVYVQSAAAGTWTVQVSGYNVPNGPQPFALVVDGDFGDVDHPPMAMFTFDCTGLTCDFDASGSYDPDGSIITYAWSFGDSSTGSGETTSHTYGAAGTFTVVLTVTDNDGATDTDTKNVTVNDSVQTMFVYAIDMLGKKAGPNRTATATVTIHDTDDNPVDGATVYGTWSGDYGASASGVTLADGTVTLSSGKVRQADAVFTFTVVDVSKSGYTYDPGLNGETSDTITVP